MYYKFLWAEGELEVAPGYGKIHHFILLRRMIQNGKLPSGSMPENYVGGTYIPSTHHQAEFDTVEIVWSGGQHPTAEELKYIVGRELDRFGDREADYRREAAFPNIVWVEHEVSGEWGNGGENRRPVVWMPKENTLLVGERDSSHYETIYEWNGKEFPEYNLMETWGYGAVWLNGEFASYSHYVGPNPPEITELIRRGDARRTAATSEDTEPVGDQVGFLRDPHDTLYPPAFGESETMDVQTVAKLKAYFLNAVEEEFKDADQFCYFTIFGSGVSYNWDEAGDFDIQVWVDHAKFLESHPGVAYDQDDLIADIRRIIHPINFPSFADLGLTGPNGEGKMLIQYYAKPGTGSPEENLASKPYACYDMETNEWLVKPEPIRPTFYGEAFGLVKAKAEEIATQAEGLIAELERHILNWQFWYGMHRRYRNHKYRAEFELSQAKAIMLQEGVKTLFDGVFEGRKGAYSEEGKGYQDERDFLQKLLEVWGTFQKLKHYARMALPWDEQELPAAPEDESGTTETGDGEERESKIKPHTWTISQTGWNVNSGWTRRIHKVAEWQDIQEKAKRYYNGGAVTLLRNGQDNTVAQVNGDNGTYETEIWRDDPNNPNVISLWNCSCPWGQHSWGRTRQWKKYEGRPCAHVLAVNWESQRQPKDTDEQGNEQMQLPGDWNLQSEPEAGQTWEQFVAPTAPIPGGPNMPAPTPTPPPTPPPPPPRPQRPPSRLKGVQDLQTTLDMPGTFSKVATFNNGQIVRTRKTQTGLDRDNYERVIPANSAGEVLWSDEDETIVIFPLDTGILQPHLVKVIDSTENFYSDEKSQPFVKKKSGWATTGGYKWYYKPATGEFNAWYAPGYDGHPTHLQVLLGDDYQDEEQGLAVFDEPIVAGEDNEYMATNGATDDDKAHGYQLFREWLDER